jgi:uncharacterized delta-60 repeat protein
MAIWAHAIEADTTYMEIPNMVYTATQVKMVKSIGRRMKLGAGIKLLMVASAFSATGAWAQTAGSLDATFGTGGTVTTTFTGSTLIPIGAVEQSNGDIVVLSQFDVVNDFGTQIGLTRYTSSGVLDTTFGTKGSTFTAFSSITFDPFAFTLDANGNILVAGTATTTAGVVEFGLARFTANGVLDTTFGSGGVATIQVGTRPDAPSAFLLQPSGQILMGGFEDGGGKHVPGMLSFARFNGNGALDTTFGTAGVSLVTPTVLGPDALAILSNGDYLAVGDNSSGRGGIVVELSSTGVLESTVTAGALTASSPEQSLSIFQPNGDYIVAQAVATVSHNTSAKVERFGETGAQDSTFSSTAFSFGAGAKDAPQVVALQSNGQVVVGGIISNASPIFGGLARLDTNGELDTTFGDGGMLTTDNSINGLLIETNGDIVAIEVAGADMIKLARYLAN